MAHYKYLKPKLFVRFSLPLNKIFYKKFHAAQLRKLREKSKPFLEYLEKNKQTITEIIPQFTGFGWQRGVIFIYLCEKFPSGGISDPFILRFNSDTDMFYYLIHELVHINLTNNDIFLLRKKVRLFEPGHSGLEVIVSLVVKHVLLKIWNKDKIKEIIEKDMKIHKEHKRMWAEVEKLGWDLSKTLLKNYLEKF